MHGLWKTYVERGEYPPVDYSDATATALANRYREPEPTSIELPSEFDELGAEYETLSASITAAEKQKKLIQNRVKEQLGNASVGVLGDGAGFSWKGNPRRFGRIKKGSKMGNELVKTNGNGKAPIVAGGKGLQLRSLDDFYRFAQYVATSGIARRGSASPSKF